MNINTSTLQRTLTKASAALCCAGLLAACGVGPKPQPAVGTYDFGLPSYATGQGARKLALKSLGQIEVAAPRWLDSANLYYRLAYADAAQPRAYTQTKWVMPPANLVEARLKERAVAGGTVVGASGPLLKIEIDEFSQVFTAAQASKGVLRARATLVGAPGSVKQKAFVFEEPATSADGPGGAAALSRASDSLVEAVLAWAGE
jgi:cholesterol transport system auxiliary component